MKSLCLRLKGKLLTPDQFLAACMKEAGNVYLAVEGEKTVPTPLFLTNATGLASIISNPDYSVLRRIRPFDTVRVWHPLVLSAVKALKIELEKAKVAEIK
jgi:hypothetical protein